MITALDDQKRRGKNWFQNTHGGAKHAEDLAALVAHDALLLLVVEDGHREAARVVLVRLEVDLPQVGEVVVQRVRDHVLALGVLVVGGREAPSCLTASASLFPLGTHMGARSPFSPRCQCTEDTVTKSSSPLSFLAMIARVAWGTCSSQSQVLASTSMHHLERQELTQGQA